MRNLKVEASEFANGADLVRVKENRKAVRAGSQWFAWDVHAKSIGDRAGRCLVTLIHPPGKKFV